MENDGKLKVVLEISKTGKALVGVALAGVLVLPSPLAVRQLSPRGLLEGGAVRREAGDGMMRVSTTSREKAIGLVHFRPCFSSREGLMSIHFFTIALRGLLGVRYWSSHLFIHVLFRGFFKPPTRWEDRFFSEIETPGGNLQYRGGKLPRGVGKKLWSTHLATHAPDGQEQ